jgi:hypothetical protein
VGQSTSGGLIACLNGGSTNLIVASSQSALGTIWGGVGIEVGAGAQSVADGASNSAAIVAALTGGNAIDASTYAAGICSIFEIDSQGNTPCEAGNACYNDWFLPAVNQLNCLYTNRVAIGGFSNDDYWTSTEGSFFSADEANGVSFLDGDQLVDSKNNAVSYRSRCVRAFSP